MKHPTRLEVALGFAAVYFLWGSTYLAIKFAVATIPPLLMAGTRHLAAGVILYLYARRRAERPTKRQWISAAAIGALLLLGGNGLVSWAEQRVASGPASLIIASVPLWMVALSSAVARRRPATPVLVGLAFGLAGIAFLVLPAPSGSHAGIDPLGAGVLLLAALSWSIGSLYSRHAPLPSSTLLATGMESLAGGAILWVVGLAAGEGASLHASSIDAKSALALAYLIVFGSVIGFSAYVWILKVSSPERASTYAFVNPIVAVVLGVVLGGEALTLRIAVAAAVILAAVALILKFGKGRTVVSEAGAQEQVG